MAAGRQRRGATLAHIQQLLLTGSGTFCKQVHLQFNSEVKATVTPSGAHEECPFQVGVLDRPQKLRYRDRRMCKATLRSENGRVHSGVKGLGAACLRLDGLWALNMVVKKTEAGMCR